MNYREFYENYPEDEVTFVKVESTGQEIRINLQVRIFAEYIANGLRSSFDSAPVHQFVFHQKEEVFALNNPVVREYSLKEDGIHLLLNDSAIILNDCSIAIRQYIQS